MNVKKIQPKVLINVGALLDIPTASIITGRKGEAIYNGGLGQVTGIVGTGNNYKSTILHYMMLSAAARIVMSHPTLMSTYDTEVNISIDRLEEFARQFPQFGEFPITGAEPFWDVSDKTLEPGNKWFTTLGEYSEAKAKDKASIVTYEAFSDPYTKEPLKAILPSFVQIDSLTEFEAESSVDMLSGDLDSSDTNTFAMKQGLFKTKAMVQVPRLTNQANIYMLMTAQIGEKIDMATGPAKYNQPSKQLQYLKNSDKIKGATGKFFFLLNNAWQAHTATLLKNQTTKKAEYPMSKDDELETELNTVKLTQLRSKSGPSGYTIPVVVSQLQGVIPHLTEFHYIKENGRYGIDGSNTSYRLDLRPDVSLSRTTVRAKLNNDELLRRAVNITAEMLQLQVFQLHYLNFEQLVCTPKELYDDIKAMGYDWDKLLDSRGFWVINQYSYEVPYLNTIDLLRMRKGTYHPYWYPKEGIKNPCLEKKDGK